MREGRFARASEDSAPGKPAGGFAFISGTAMLSVWWAYQRQIVNLLDLRVWLACFELMARRCGLRGGRVGHYSIQELMNLVDSHSEGSVRRSISRLRRCGLLMWSESMVRVGHLLPHPPDDDHEGFVEQVANARRRIPVPRRVIRMLAKDGSKVMIATVLGHLLRCLYYRDGSCQSTGTCKARLIAATFGVDVRSVKAARKALVATGLLRIERRSQRFLNRHGSLVTVNLAWESGSRCRHELPPPPQSDGRGLPPPKKKPELLRKINNQNPPTRAPGICLPTSRSPAPNLRHVVAADLTDVSRLEALHEQAQRAGYVNGSQADRLGFFAAAEHARAVGTRNAPGLFAYIVRSRRYGVITLADEDAATRRLWATEGTSQGGREIGRRGLPAQAGVVAATILKAITHPPRRQGPSELVGRIRAGDARESIRLPFL